MTGKENREIKNSVFVDLFYEDESAEANEIALFNAIHDEPLPEGTKIRKFRVDNTIYMNFQNDISFDAGGKVIVFGEHQSTINENMPLRSLLYIGRAYERLVPPFSYWPVPLSPWPCGISISYPVRRVTRNVRISPLIPSWWSLAILS